MSFSDIIGHETPIAVLQRAVASNRLPPGYLFVGPPNVGKTKTARELTKAISCQNRPRSEDPAAVNACDECVVCRQIERGIYPYVRVEFPMLKAQEELRRKQLKKQQEQGPAPGDAQGAEGELAVLERIEIAGAEIVIDRVREMLQSASLKAPEGVWKAYIIQSAEKLRDEAANRLLKTLEEPPPRTTFILTTSRPADVLPTIVSRCQVIDFGPVPQSKIMDALRSELSATDAEEARAIVTASAGRYGWARWMLSRPPMRANRRALLNLLAGLPRCQLYEGMRRGEVLIKLAEKWFLDSYEPEGREAETAQALLKATRDQILRAAMIQLLDIMLSWWRDVALLVSAPASDNVMNCDYREQLRQLAVLYGAGTGQRAIRWVQDARDHFQGNANLRLTAELLMLKLISLSPTKL